VADNIQLQDPQTLKDFAADVRTMVSLLTDTHSRTSGFVTVPAPVAFGQNATQTIVPWMLSRELGQRMSDIDGNVQTLIAKLNLIATAAEKIADNYNNAAILDKLGAGVVDDALASS
jgi:hypothetical protein